MQQNKNILLYVLILFFSVAYNHLNAQGIRGTISSVDGEPVPFANIYIEKLSKGTTSNIDGKYELKIPPGTHKITYQYLGYQTQNHTITIGDKYVHKNIILQKQQYEIPEVIVYADNEDPAYHIMRKAIAMAQYYKNQVRSYKCRVYLKGTGVIEDIPGLLKNRMKKEGIEEGETFVTENISNIYFELPNKIEQKVISLRSNSYSQSINPMNYVTLSLYHDIEKPVSPLDKRAFNLYEFELVNSYYDKERLINNIKVIPKREGFDLYKGNIHIAEDFWNIHSVDLMLEQKMFKLNIRQIYSPVKGEIWMPVSHQLDAEFSAMGFEGTFRYAGSVNYKNVERNEALDHSFLKKTKENLIQRKQERERVYAEAAEKQKQESLSRREKKLQHLSEKKELNNREARKLNRMMEKEVKRKKEKPPLKIENNFEILDSARNRPVSYWDSIRPIPLTEKEKIGYEVKDSIDKLMEDPEYRDSVKQAKKKFRFNHLIGGNTYKYPNNDSKLSFHGLIGLRNISFNTVDGWLYKTNLSYRKNYKEGKYWRFENDVSFASARQTVLSDLSIRYRYDPLNRSYIYLSGGRKTEDFNSTQGFFRGLNMLTTLFLKENYIKFYQKDFIRLGHAFDLANGLRLTTNIEYADYSQLFNNTSFNIWDPLNNEDYSSNIPSNRNLTQDLVHDHTSFHLYGKIAYTPRYYYEIEDNVKHMRYSKYPTFYLTYKGGYKDVFKSDTRYDFLQASIKDYFTIKGIGSFSYYLSSGAFWNTKNMHFSEFKHFSSTPSYLAANLGYSDFRLMDYYGHSTNDRFFEGHMKFSNDRIFLKRLPLLNKTLMIENIYFHYLKTPARKNYYEIGYGLNQVFMFLNLEVFSGFEGSHHKYTGFKISLPLITGSQTFRAGS